MTFWKSFLAKSFFPTLLVINEKYKILELKWNNVSNLQTAKKQEDPMQCDLPKCWDAAQSHTDAFPVSQRRCLAHVHVKDNLPFYPLKRTAGHVYDASSRPCHGSN